MAMICPTCKAELEFDNAEVCPKCGVRIRVKSPLLAAVLSFFIPGLGQVYNGEFGKGIAFFLIAGFCGAMIWIGIGLILYPLFLIYNIYDAHNIAKKLNSRQIVIRRMSGRDIAIALLMIGIGSVLTAYTAGIFSPIPSASTAIFFSFLFLAIILAGHKKTDALFMGCLSAVIFLLISYSALRSEYLIVIPVVSLVCGTCFLYLKEKSPLVAPGAAALAGSLTGMIITVALLYLESFLRIGLMGKTDFSDFLGVYIWYSLVAAIVTAVVVQVLYMVLSRLFPEKGTVSSDKPTP